MTLLATTTRQSFACDGVSQDFPIGIVYYDKADLQVWLKDDASGAETELGAHQLLETRLEGRTKMLVDRALRQRRLADQRQQGIGQAVEIHCATCGWLRKM